MATNNDDIKWLYGKLKAKGYDIGNEQEFTTSLTNEADRQWYYEKAKGMGLNIGSIEDFNSLYAPQTAQPATPPIQAPAVQPTATAAPTSTPTPAEEPEQAPVQSAPPQPAWQPTEQDKIRMSYQMHTMLNDFNQRSKERIAQIQRMAEPFTAEGRRKRKAMEFQAQLAGTPTKVMGLTPPTSAPASDGAQSDVEEAAQPQPIQSGQSPVPYGVKYIDGKPVTQWLLPDGRLTTSFMEADQAEYGARTARLRHQFENRMKQNGLDPAKPEDVEMQAQYDAQAPAYDAVAELWQEAEEKHKADKERNAKKHWDSYAAMGGGREMRIVTTSMNRHDDNISHMTRFDLQKMMDNAWNRVGSKVTTNCYNRLRQQYPGASEEELQATASQMARQLTDNAVYQYAVQQNTPKSTLEYFGRTVADMNVINSISKGLARSQAGTSGDLAAYEAAMGEYGKNHRVAQIAGTVTGMAVDPVTWVSGGVGSLAGKGAINLGGRFIAGRAATSMSTQVGSRLFSSSLTGRIITGAAAGGGNFATYEMLKEGESQFLHGGHINPETGENEGYSAGAVLSAGGHGLVLGSVTGTLSPVIGNVADKTVKATTSTAGKAGVRFGEIAVSTLAEGTVFSIPEWINGDADAMDVWTDNMAMMLGFKVQHGLKSAPRYIASLRPIKPVDGRPLTQAERNHNRMNFEERLRRNLDASPSNLSFTADEREELRRAGYGELADLFSRDRVQEVQRPDIDPADGAIELRAERVEAETISRNPEFDGYSSMEELMQDGRVSQSARAKAYYILTGRRLPMASVTGYTTTTDADGRVTVNSMAADGEVVTSRTFKNEQEAKQETDNIMRQAELNSVDIGERFKEAVADDMVLDAAISEVSPGADPATIKRIYRAVKAGNKDVTESQRQLVEFLDDAIERNRDIADRYRPEAIREVLKEETGIDVDAVLRKMPSKRTEAEQAVVKSYLERLFPEEARQQAAEPTPEQAEAQSQYEQGRELYGRFEEGDPTVQADVDAIVLRMQEAYQAVEDAFGSEAEYYMFHVNENPWALVDAPELTVEQKDAVLYYINAKAALDGVMDASNEVADRKRAEIEESVAKRTHKDNGVIIPATMKVDDRPVYIVKGDVVMFPDGSAVDVHNSSESVVVMDAQTGEYKFTSPDQIFQVSEAVNPQDELDTALSVIEQEQMNIFGDNAVAPEDSATDAEAPQQDDIAPLAQPAEAEAPATADTEAYDRGYEQGIAATNYTDEELAEAIEASRSYLNEGSLDDFGRGRLEGLEYEQQRRAMEAQSVPETPESVPNPAENPVSDAEIAPETVPSAESGQQTALSRIPINEQGEPMFEAVDKDTAWDGLVEAVGGEADAVDIAMAQVQQATSDLEALKKKPPTQKAPKLKGSKMMQNSMENRVLEEEEDSFGDMTAQLSGSEYAILKNQAEREVRNLTAKQKGHDLDQIYVHNQLPKVEGFIKGAERRIEIENKNLEIIGSHFPDGTIKKITIGKLTFDSVAAMEDFFKEQNAKMNEAAENIREGADNYTSKLVVDVDGLKFEVTTTVSRTVDNKGQGTLTFEPERNVTYSCEALGIKGQDIKGNRLKNIMQKIAEDIVTGRESRELLSRGQQQLAHYTEERTQLEQRNGREFPHKQELAEAKERLAKYEEAMKKELAEKEAKYAELDKSVETASDITLTDEDSTDTPTTGDGNKYRLVAERELLDFLDGQPLKKGYRYSQWANMGVLPPMTAKQNGEWRAPMIFSRWEQSEEGMRKENGKADLVQGNGRTTGDVAYNPYFHIRTSPLNDQFTAAYDRPELLVVEGYYPESEETSGYQAEGAKNSVGLMDWHSGSVNGQLSDDTKVQTMLSRYFKPERIVPWSEVADLIMERVGDQKITFPINAVPPMLRAELAKRGAKFGDISGSVAEADIPMLNELRDRVNAGEWDAGLEKARAYLDAYESSTEAKEARVADLSARANTPVRIVRTQEEADALPTRRERRAKGWWSAKDDEVVIVLPNNVNVADVDNTFVHEVAGHKGLRALVGEERFDEFLGEIYDHASNPIRKVIDKMTDRMVSEEADRLRTRKAQAHERAGEDVNANYYTDMAEARVEAEKKRKEFRKEATEEYMSDLGGRIGSEGFEKMSRDELTLWGKIKAKVQAFLDKFLQGLKIAKSIRLNDKDLSYILYKSWKNLRKKGVFADAEDVVMRRRTGYDADEVTRFRDPGLGLEETITKMKAEAMQANAGNLQAKRDAMRAIGGNLNHLRQAMARQREYDITTVKSVADLARVLMDTNLLDDLSKYETKRILGAINNVVGKQDVSQYVQKVMDIMVGNQLRRGYNTFGRLLSIRGSHVDARGIEVQGELDPDGQRIAQVVRKSTSLPKEIRDANGVLQSGCIEYMLREAINRMGSTDQAIADDATIEYAGLQIARQYVEGITESIAEEKALRDSIKQAKEDKDAGQMTESAYRQYVASTEDAIRQNKIERAESYRSLSEQLGGVLCESVERAKAWREAEKQRVEEIHHNANSDMEGRPTDEHHKDDRLQKFTNNDLARGILAPLATFDQMLRMFGKKNSRGEGYLWNRYMRGWVTATEKEYTGYRDALKVLDAKVSEIYGKDMTWGDLFTIDRKLPKASVRFFDGGEMKDHELTQGNLLYIYMADKMSDGRMKLRRMGITEEDIEDIKNFLDPKFMQLADWMQEEFLVDKRNEYNEVHKRMFGASMAAIENYFPLKILANARLEDVDVADDTTDTALPATSTGSIIKRRRNNLALDVTGANAFSVILDHLQQMERWAAFAEFNRDLNTLLSYKRFRNQVMNMSSVYGAGKTLWNNFRNVCSMAAGAYRPPIAALDKSWVNLAKGVTAAKVSFRVFTALKQFLSMPAYASDSNPLYLAANIANPIGAWRWSMENLPLFEKRWRSRMAGDPRLLRSEMDWKMWRSRVVELASRVGMAPNAFVDALTVAIGAHAMYQTKLAKYKRMGYDPDVAEERAKQDATILFNQTQQSSEGAFLSTMQVDRSWLSVLFTVFRNSSMSYTRQLYDSLRNIGRRLTPGYKALSEEFMAKQMRRDGIDPDKADRNAKQEYRRGIIRDLVRVGIFGYVLQLAWNLGAYLPYLIFGDDDDEKDKMWDDVFTHTMFGSIEGLTGGDVYSNTLNTLAKGEELTGWVASKDMPASSDLQNIWTKWNTDEVSAMNDVINLLVQSAVGVNPQSLTDAVVAIMDVCGDDAQTSRECALLMARILNCPQSQLDKIYFDELGATGEEASQMTPYEIAERYARYKVRRGAPLTGWAYGNEQREKIMDKYRKKSNTLAKERLTRETDTQASPNMTQWLEEFEATKDRVSDIKKVKSLDEDRYYELLDELEATPEFSRYEIIRAYKHDVDELTKEWLNATTPAQRDSCAQAILTLKRDMVRELSDTQQ